MMTQIRMEGIFTSEIRSSFQTLICFISKTGVIKFNRKLFWVKINGNGKIKLRKLFGEESLMDLIRMYFHFKLWLIVQLLMR